MTSRPGRPPTRTRVARAERSLGIDVAAIQRSAVARGAVGAALTWFYAVAYWPSVAVSVLYAAVVDRRTVARAVAAFGCSGAIGVVVLTVWPVAPPRLTGGASDHVARSELLTAVAHPSGWFNPYAAMPSFHVAWTLLAAATAAAAARTQTGRSARARGGATLRRRSAVRCGWPRR